MHAQYLATTLLLVLLALGYLGRQAVEGAPNDSSKMIRVALSKSTSMQAGIQGQPVTSYYTHIGVGTPSKGFNMLIDTTARETWLPHHLKLGLIYKRLNYKNGYAKRDSSSGQKEDKEYSFDYRRCELEGKAYEDTFEFKNATEVFGGAKAEFRQRFLAISSASNDRFSDLAFDGVLSLGPAYMSDTGTRSLLVGLNQAKLIDDMRFSLYLDKREPDSDQGGELTLGGANRAKYIGEFYWHPLVSMHDRWELAIQSVMLGGQFVSCHQRQCTAVLSTGANDLYGPREDVRLIASLLGVGNQLEKQAAKNGEELYEIDCLRVAELPALTFMVDGTPYVVPPSSYIKKKLDGLIFKSTTCYVTIIAHDSSNQWILGTNFLANFYTSYDLNRRQVGFATRVVA